MQIYPAIDMKGGNCVRLRQGEFSDVTVYDSEPYKVAMEFERQGATFIHLVDLDGALEGRSVNEAAIRKIIENVHIPCELGGGIRSIEDIRRVLSYGIYRVIIGTKAVQEPAFVKEAIETFGAEHIVVGVDAKNGYVATHGWEKVSDQSALSMVLAMKDMGVRTIVYTDISKDGMLCGPNIEMTQKLTMESGINIIASGGVSSMEDLANLRNAGIHGAITGKAIYEKRIDLQAAIKEYQCLTEIDPISFKELKLLDSGLIPVVVQEEGSKDVLMVAYMNEEAFLHTKASGVMTYYSRSRKELWIKGLTSGHFQYVKSLHLDCDNDTLLAVVEQVGAACHTGSHSCFFKEIAKI